MVMIMNYQYSGISSIYMSEYGADVIACEHEDITDNERILITITDENISNEALHSWPWYGYSWYTIFVPETYSEEAVYVTEEVRHGVVIPDCTMDGIGEMIFDREDSLDSFSFEDTDEDGIPDVLEEEGMYGIDGQVYYSDPTLPDSDGDTLSDGDEMGTMHRVLRIDEDTVQIDRIHLFNVDEVGASEYSYLESYIPENPNEICFVFDVVSDPMLKDTDGDFYWDKVDPNPMESDIETISLGGSSYILTEEDLGYIHVTGIPECILNEDSDSTEKSEEEFYGGYQYWFRDDVVYGASIYTSGCGLIATNDVMLYLSNGISSYDWNSYHDYVIATNNNFLLMQTSTGQGIPIPNSYALSHWAVQECLLFNGYFSNSYSITPVNQGSMLTTIEQSLADNHPVILMEDDCYQEGRADLGFAIYEVNRNATSIGGCLDLYDPTGMNYHYVTITGLMIDHNDFDNTYFRIQSWGMELYLNYSEFIEYNETNTAYFGRIIVLG